MKIRRSTGLIISGLLSVGFFAMALITLLPAEASKPNRVGYYSVCSFSPISTLILLIFSAIFILIVYRLFYSVRSSEKVRKKIMVETIN